MADVIGTSENDSLVGTADADFIQGLGGTDTIEAGAGNDEIIVTGEGQNVIDAGNGDDIITDFTLDDDTLDLSETATDFIDLASLEAAATNATQDGQTGLLIDTGAGESVFLIGLTVDDLTSINIVF